MSHADAGFLYKIQRFYFFCITILGKISVNFSRFWVISLYHKSSEARLSSPESEWLVASRVAERRKTKDLGKLGNFKKIVEIFEIDDEFPAGHPKSRFWQLCSKIIFTTF